MEYEILEAAFAKAGADLAEANKTNELLKAQHDANERKLHRNKAERTKFDVRSTRAELEQDFSKAHADVDDPIEFPVGDTASASAGQNKKRKKRVSELDRAQGRGIIVTHR